MAVNVLYEVRIDEINTEARRSVSLGVTRIPPAELTVPTLSEDLRESVIIWESGIRRRGYIVKSNVANALKFINVGSRVGVLVDSSKNLHIYVDGSDQGVAAKDVAQPCFAVFDLFMNVTQVTARLTSRRT